MKPANHIGHTDCPVCGHDSADVKTDKNGRAYIHCKHSCSWQGITRTDYQSNQLKARMRVVTPSVTVTDADPAPVKAPDAEPPKAAPAPVVKATVPPKSKPAWFAPILGSNA